MDIKKFTLIKFKWLDVDILSTQGSINRVTSLIPTAFSVFLFHTSNRTDLDI